MSQLDLEIRAAGLHPDPNPHSDVPAGALLRADDVVIRRSGVIEPRPGLEDLGYGSLASKRIAAVHPYDGSYVVTTRTSTGTGGTGALLNNSGTEITLNSSTIPFASHHVHSAAYRDRLYVPTSDGVVRVEGADATTATLAGLPRAKSGYGARTDLNRLQDEWFPVEGFGNTGVGSVAYRCVLADEETSGELRLGPPSGRWIVSTGSNTAGPGGVALTIPVHSGWAGIQLRIYRSEVSEVHAPSDEMSLALEHVITTAEASAGKVELVDAVLPTKRGESLYTNATQVGAEGEYAQPPTVGTIAEYRDIIFAGRVTGRGSMVMEFGVTPQRWFTDTASTITADTTNGSQALANVSESNDYTLYGLAIKDGSDFDTNGTNIAANTLLEWTGSAWQLSQNAIGTAAAVSCDLTEWIDVDGPTASFRVFFTANASELNGDIEGLQVAAADGTAMGSTLYPLERVLGNVAAAINFQDETMTAAYLGGGALLLETVEVGDAITVTMPHRLARSVGFDIGATDSTASETSTADLKPHRLVWSALQIPEGFPPLQFLDLGSESHPILALVPSRYGVFAFKYDGIWRIDGRTPTGLSAERIASARLVAPKAAALYDDDVYAWTDQGVVRIGPNGLGENLSAGPLEVWLGETQRAWPTATAGTAAFLAIDRGDGALYLGVPSGTSGGGTTAEWVYRFDFKTKAWTRWDLDATHAAVIDDRLHLAIYGAYGTEATVAGRLLRARLSTATYPHHDDSGTATISAIDSSGSPTVVLTLSGSGYDANVGDWIETDTISETTPVGVITAVDGVPGFGTVDVTVLLVDGAGGISTATTATIYLGPDCVIEWKPRTAQNPMMRKLWSDVILSFETLDRFYSVDWEFRGTLSETAATSNWTRTPELDRARPEPWRGGFVPRNTCRAEQLFCRATIHNPGGTWGLTSLQLRYLAQGTRVGKRAP